MRSSAYNRFGFLMGTSWPASCPRWYGLREDSLPMITLFPSQGDFYATAPGHFAVFFRHAVDEVAEIERQVGHVEDALATEHLVHGVKSLAGAEHAFDELQRKLIMAGGDGRMGGEHALLTDGLHIVVGEGHPASTVGLLVQQFQGQQA